MLTPRGMFIGVITQTFLAGVATTQLYGYYRRHQKDATPLKILVAVCATTIFTGVVLCSFTLYRCTVSNFDNLLYLTTPKTPLDASMFITVLPSAISQLFFAWCVMRLTGRLWVFILAIVLALLQAITVTLCSIVTFRYLDYTKREAERVYMTIWFCAEVATNLLNTCHLAYFFRTKRTGFRDTDDLLKRFGTVTIRSGLAITVWSIAAACTYCLSKDDIPRLFLQPAPPLYLVTFLSILHSRYCRGPGGEIEWTMNSRSGQVWSSPPFPSTVSRHTPLESRVHHAVELEEYDSKQIAQI